MSELFSRVELQVIAKNYEGLRFLWYTALDEAREPFHGLCDLITRGKGFCVPATLAQQGIAASCLFASFAGMDLGEEELPLNVAMSFADIGAGLQTMSEKWSSYSLDQLLSVALLLDLSGEGSVSYEDFLSFIQLANDSLQQDPNHSEECFLTFYECLVERMRGSLHGFCSEADYNLESRLVSLSQNARSAGLHPLSLLLDSMKEVNEIEYSSLLDLITRLGGVIESEVNSQNIEDTKTKESKDKNGEKNKGNEVEKNGNSRKGKKETKIKRNEKETISRTVIESYLNFESHDNDDGNYGGEIMNIFDCKISTAKSNEKLVSNMINNSKKNEGENSPNNITNAGQVDENGLRNVPKKTGTKQMKTQNQNSFHEKEEEVNLQEFAKLLRNVSVSVTTTGKNQENCVSDSRIEESEVSVTEAEIIAAYLQASKSIEESTSSEKTHTQIDEIDAHRARNLHEKIQPVTDSNAALISKVDKKIMDVNAALHLVRESSNGNLIPLGNENGKKEKYIEDNARFGTNVRSYSREETAVHLFDVDFSPSKVTPCDSACAMKSAVFGPSEIPDSVPHLQGEQTYLPVAPSSTPPSSSSSSSSVHVLHTQISNPPLSSLPTRSISIPSTLLAPVPVSSSTLSPFPLPPPFPPLPHSTQVFSLPTSLPLDSTTHLSPASSPISSASTSSSVIHYHSQSPTRTRTHSVFSHSDDVIGAKRHSSRAENKDVCGKKDEEDLIVVDKNVYASRASDDKESNTKHDEVIRNNEYGIGSNVANKNTNVMMNVDSYNNIEDEKGDIIGSVEDEDEESISSVVISLLELQEEQTSQMKLHEIQQEIIKQQQKELQFLKNDVLRKVAEKEKEKEELQIQRDILLAQTKLRKLALTNNTNNKNHDSSSRTENSDIKKNNIIGIRSNEENHNKKKFDNFENNVTQVSELDDPYEDLPRPKKITFVPERSLEYLSPKERSIRNSQLKKMDSQNLIVASKDVRNSSQRQNVPITDHIQSLKANVRILSAKLSHQQEDVQNSLQLWNILGELEAQLKKNTTSPTRILHTDEKMSRTNEDKATPKNIKKYQNSHSNSNLNSTFSGVKSEIKPKNIRSARMGGKSPDRFNDASQPKSSSDAVIGNSGSNDGSREDGDIGMNYTGDASSSVRAVVLTDTGTDPISKPDRTINSRDSRNQPSPSPVKRHSGSSPSPCNYSIVRDTMKSRSMSKLTFHTRPISNTPSGGKLNPDLSIFRSPLARQKVNNVNQYNERNGEWVATSLTGKYNSRFQNTTDIANAKKLNQMLNI